MSRAIDQRIVEMSFENHKFEKGILKSKNSLKEFSSALQKMGDGQDFSGLDRSVQSITKSFSMLEQVGIGALRRIGEVAANTGASLIKSLTVDQLSAGLSKYQQKIEAVQTMVSAGYGLDEVEKSMTQLMWFSDETSYSFADMAGNMAKFIAAGVDLKASERAMQGIATWAAHSGKNSQAASIAMFNLSQAISMGYVDTMNWRSIMNQNMNTTMFKRLAIDVAEATGAIKKGQVTIQNFDSNLRDKWFTNDVLLKTLDQYSAYADKVREVQETMNFDTAKQAMDYMDANAENYADVINQIGNAAFKASQESKSFMDSINATMDAVSSGWLKSYEIIFGTLFEAKENFGALTEVLWTVFASSAETRNEMLQMIKDAGGIKLIFQSIKNSAVAILKPLKAVSEAFDQFFPPKTADQWMGIIGTLEYVTKKLIITDETADKLRRTFAGFFAVVDIGWQTFKFLGSALFEVLGIFIPLNGGILSMSASFGDFLVVLNHVIKQSGIFEYALLGVRIAAISIRNILSVVGSKIQEFIRTLLTTEKPLEFLSQTVGNLFKGTIDALRTGVTWISGKFLNALRSVQKFLDSKFDMSGENTIGGILGVLKDFVGFLMGGATDTIFNFGDAIKNLDFNKIATFVTGGIILMFINQLTNLTKVMSGLLSSLNSFVTKFSKRLFASQTKIKDFAFAIGVLSASLYVLSKIPWEDLKKGLVGLAGAMFIFVAAYGAIQAVTVIASKKLNGAETIKSAFNLTALAGGLAIMAVAIQQISKIDESRVWKSVGVVGAMMGLLTAYQALSVAISLIPGTRTATIKINGMMTGLLGMVGVITVLNLLSPSTIANGLTKLAGAMIVIASIQALFSLAAKLSGGYKLSTNLLSLSLGIVALIGVLKLITVISSSDITRGIGNVLLIGGVLTALQLMFNLAGRISGGIKAKTNILSIQMGLISMIALSTILGKMNQTDLQNGIKNLTKMTGIIAGLQILTAVAARIGGGHKLQRILGSVTITLTAFTTIIGVLGIYKDSTIDRGLKTIAKMSGIILALQALSAVISRIGGITSGVGTLLGLSTLLLTVTASLSLLSIIDQDSLRQATSSLGMAVVSIGMMAAGIGVMIKALSSMSGTFGGLKTIVTNLIPGFIILTALIGGAIAFIGVLKLATPWIESISWDSIGKFAAGLGLMTVLIAAFANLAKIPGMGSGISSLLGMLPGFAGVGALVIATAGMFVVIKSVMPMVESMSWAGFEKFITGIALLGVLVTGLTLLSPLLMALGAGFGPAMAGALAAILGAGLLIAAFVGLSSAVEYLFGSDPDFLIRGIEKMIIIAEGLGRFFGSLVGGFTAALIVEFGNGLAGFADAVKGIDASSFDGVDRLAKALLALTTSALIDGFARLIGFDANPGKVFGEQMKGLVEAFKSISVKDATKTAEILSALTPLATNLKILADAAKDIPRTGGFIGGFLGENNADEFGRQITGFVKALKNLTIESTKHASDILIEMNPMVSNLKKFASAAGKIPNSGGFMAEFLGDNTVDMFGAQLESFIYMFSNISIEDSIRPAKESLSAMVPLLDELKLFIEAANMIPNSGGMVTWFSGDNSIDKFAKQIEDVIITFGNFWSREVRDATNNMSLISMSLLPGLEKLIILAGNIASTPKPTKGNTFEDLGKSLAGFVKSLAGVDLGVVGPAMESLEKINESFKVVGSDIVASATQSIVNNQQPFQTAIIMLLHSAVNIVNEEKYAVSKSFTNLLNQALIDSRRYVDDFRTLGYDLVRGLQNGIKDNQNVAIYAANNMAKAVIKDTRAAFEINSPSKVFSEIGRWLPEGLGVGITRNRNVAILASVNMAQGIEDAVRDTLDIHSIGKKFPSIGSWIPPGLKAGIESTKDSLLNTAKDLGIDTGNLTVKGITEGVAGGEGAITSGINSLLELLTGEKSGSTIANEVGLQSGSAFSDGYVAGTNTDAISKAYKGVAKDAFQVFKEGIDRRREYNLMSAWEEIQAWEEFTKKYKEGTEIRLKADKHLGQLRYSYSTKWIDQEKYYKRMSLEDELKAWERVQSRYAKGHEYRMQAEREIFRLKQEIWQAEYQNSLDYVDEEKYYGRMNLTEELSAWKRIVATTKDGTDERKKANREIFRLENEIREANKSYEQQMMDIETERNEKRKKLADDYYNKEKEINEKMKRDIQTVSDEYKNAVDSRAKTLYSTYGLFDKVEKPKYVSGFELINNLEDQNTAFDKWQNSIGALAAKGVDDGLIKELRDMGPKSLAQINALNRLSASELSRYVDLWQKKSKEAKDQAVFELQDMKVETDAEIKRITESARNELNYYKDVWDRALAEVNVEAKKKLDKLESDWKKSIGTMTTNGIKTIRKFRAEWFDEIEAMTKNTRVQITTLEKLMSGFDATNLTSTITKSLNSSINTTAVGTQVVNGITTGITKTSGSLQSTLNFLGTTSLNTLNNSLLIKSPSRKTMETGRNIVLGLVDGIKQLSSLATRESYGIGRSIIETLDGSMSNVTDLFDGNMESFTITPVLDLSAVRDGMVDVNSLFANANGLDLSTTMRLLPKSVPTNQNGILNDIRDGLLSMVNPEVDLSGKLTVEVVNDRGEIVGIAETAIKDLLRRESR